MNRCSTRSSMLLLLAAGGISTGCVVVQPPKAPPVQKRCSAPIGTVIVEQALTGVAEQFNQTVKVPIQEVERLARDSGCFRVLDNSARQGDSTAAAMMEIMATIPGSRPSAAEKGKLKADYKLIAGLTYAETGSAYSADRLLAIQRDKQNARATLKLSRESTGEVVTIVTGDVTYEDNQIQSPWNNTIATGRSPTRAVVWAFFDAMNALAGDVDRAKPSQTGASSQSANRTDTATPVVQTNTSATSAAQIARDQLGSCASDQIGKITRAVVVNNAGARKIDSDIQDSASGKHLVIYRSRGKVRDTQIVEVDASATNATYKSLIGKSACVPDPD